MRKEELKKQPYEAPVCRVIPVQTENFICTSVVPDAPASVEQPWESGGSVEGGEIEI